MTPQRPKIVVLGMMTKMPVAGVVWQNLHYLLGFERLGYEAYYVEAHGRTPSMLMDREHDDGSARAAEFLSRVTRRFGLSNRWAFCALHDDGRCLGMSWSQLKRLYRSAELIIDLHGGTHPSPDLTATDRLVYLETDPVQLQVELHQHRRETLEFLEPHCAFFTFGENLGSPDCGLPAPRRFHFRATRQPVVLDLWSGRDYGDGHAFTTVGNWRQEWRTVTFEGDVYTWSKHHEFLKLLGLPQRTSQPFELALSSYEEGDRRMLERAGWRVRRGLEVSTDEDTYRDFIVGSRGEFTVAKDQNVRLRTGWFSDRSATYLAAGRPVVSQETGFSNVLPTGDGLFGFSTMDEASAAVERINSDYRRQRAAASEIAREHFSHDVVLGRLLSDLGADLARRAPRPPRGIEPFPPDLVLTPVSRRPTVLAESTVRTVLDRPMPSFPSVAPPNPRTSIVVVTRENVVFARLCLESLLAATEDAYEVIAVDNASSDGTREYLSRLHEASPLVRPVLNSSNRGFAPACNQGLARARGDVLVLLNDDTLVTRGWLDRLAAHLEDPEVGMVGPTTNRIGNEAEVETSYRTLTQLVRFADARAQDHAGEAFDIPTLTMFCLAMRRDVYEAVGPLDERFEVGLLEDDDYSLRVREADYRLLCAEDAFVHHFGETSFGKLVPTGEYARLLAANRKRFEQKWGVEWKPYERRQSREYRQLRERIRRAVTDTVPPNATVLVVSRGDDDLLQLNGRTAWHFPQGAGGAYAGHHPADSEDAIAHLEELRAKGANHMLFPRTGLWWLDHYRDLRRHLDSDYHASFREPRTCVIYDLDGGRR